MEESPSNITEQQRAVVRVISLGLAAFIIAVVISAGIWFYWRYQDWRQLRQTTPAVIGQPSLGDELIFPDGWKLSDWSNGFYICERDGIYRECRPQRIADND